MLTGRVTKADLHLPALAKTSSPPIVIGKDGAPMVLVPAGTFMMGSDEYDDEKPVHRVYLDAYFIDQYELTTTRYAKFLAETNYQKPYGWHEVNLASHGNHPVIGVMWHHANVYCRWAGKRLPTEAEWEKAARGTDGRTYPWGNDVPNSRHANFNKGAWTGYTTLTSVKNHVAGKSPYGAYDMAGNVWEWVSDWYDEDYYKSAQKQNSKGPPSGEYRVIRGGSWTNDPENLRSANRLKVLTPDWYNFGIGVRCAQDAP